MSGDRGGSEDLPGSEKAAGGHEHSSPHDALAKAEVAGDIREEEAREDVREQVDVNQLRCVVLRNTHTHTHTSARARDAYATRVNGCRLWMLRGRTDGLSSVDKGLVGESVGGGGPF
eukprot:209955-Prorocentrum_minimum.AAC.1